LDAGRTALTISGFENGRLAEGRILVDALNCSVRATAFVSSGFFVSNNIGVGSKKLVAGNADDSRNDCEVEAVGVREQVGLGDLDRVGVGE
jgi:hypothetical protein